MILNMNQLLGKHYSPIGLEISQNAIRMVQVKKNRGKWILHRVAQEEFHPQESEPDSAVEKLPDIIRAMKKDHAFHGRQVVSTLANEDVDILPVRLPASDANGIEGKIIENARARLSYGVDQAVIDYLPIDALKKGGEGEKSFWIIASQRALVDQHLSLIKAAGLQTKALDIQPCALMRSLVESGCEIKENLLLIHMGDRDSLFLFIEKEAPLAHRIHMKGYLDIAEKITEVLKVERTESFRLLSHYGFIDPDPPKGKKAPAKPDSTQSTVHEIILPLFKNTFEGLKDFVNYCHAEVGEINIDRICLSGKASLVRNLDKMIENDSDIRTEVTNPFSSLAIENGTLENIDLQQGSIFSVALGLTMRE
jgi:type IV pilus assembly protein PilM